MASRSFPVIYVLAGTNGAGKSSVGGNAFRRAGADYFNPDEATRRLLAADPAVSLAQANAEAWRVGVQLLEQAIEQGSTHAFETTLGGATITRLLAEAAAGGSKVRVWYVALATVELHIERVRKRVAAGGHDIPEDAIRRRYDDSRANLISLLPVLDELRVYDNSKPNDPTRGLEPSPQLVLFLRHGKVVETAEPSHTPDWAKPIIAAALRVGRRR
jgi:predicted ABC-type ATPase